MNSIWVYPLFASAQILTSCLIKLSQSQVKSSPLPSFRAFSSRRISQNRNSIFPSRKILWFIRLGGNPARYAMICVRKFLALFLRGLPCQNRYCICVDSRDVPSLHVTGDWGHFILLEMSFCWFWRALQYDSLHSAKELTPSISFCREWHLMGHVKISPKLLFCNVWGVS